MPGRDPVKGKNEADSRGDLLDHTIPKGLKGCYISAIQAGA